MTMFQILALLCAAIACSYGFQHPLVADQIHEDDYQAKQAQEVLKHILSSSSEDNELKQGQLGFSWDNCGKVLFILLHELNYLCDGLSLFGD